VSIVHEEVRKLPRNHPRPRFKKTYTKRTAKGIVRVVVYREHFPGSHVLSTTDKGLPKEEMSDELFKELWPTISPSVRKAG